MRTTVFLLALLLTATLLRATAAPAAASVNPLPIPTPHLITARDSHLAFMGRVAFGTADEARMAYPGITVRFVYRGPAPTLRLSAFSETCYVNLSCNNWEPVKIHLKSGENSILLPSGPAPASGWLVEIVRRTEAWQGVIAFDGLTLPPGCELLAPPAWPKRKLLCIGDSITCGECIDGLPPGDSTSLTPASANASRAYGMLLGRALNSQVHLVSYGGRGVVRTWDAKRDSNNAPQFFPLSLPDDPTVRWDHTSYTPDAIIICLGQNDFSAGLLEETEYTEAYARFVDQIRTVHPRAAFVFASSPMQGNEPGSEDRAKRDRLVRCLENVAARLRTTSKTKVAVVALHHQPGTVLNAHPSAFQHEQIAQEILPVLKSLTGW